MISARQRAYDALRTSGPVGVYDDAASNLSNEEWNAINRDADISDYDQLQDLTCVSEYTVSVDTIACDGQGTTSRARVNCDDRCYLEERGTESRN